MKLKSLLLFTFLLVIVSIGVVWAACTDTDGGKNYYTLGHINAIVNGTPISLTDECLSGDANKLREWYCLPAGQLENGRPYSYENFDCPNGCSNRACISPFLICGNGINQTGEECDDGNLVSGDGCDSNCKIEATTNGATCTDTDVDAEHPDGINYAKKGLCTQPTGQTAKEYCNPSNPEWIFESYCDTNDICMMKSIRCVDLGYAECVDGVCVGTATGPPEQTCTDSDGGEDVEVRGTSTNWITSATDYCSGFNDWLTEIYCDEDKNVRARGYVCSELGYAGCLNGACVEEGQFNLVDPAGGICPYGGTPTPGSSNQYEFCSYIFCGQDSVDSFTLAQVQELEANNDNILIITYEHSTTVSNSYDALGSTGCFCPYGISSGGGSDLECNPAPDDTLECVNDEDCGDSNICTLDECINSVCFSSGDDSLEGEACGVDGVCDSDGYCIDCLDDSDCDDDEFCDDGFCEEIDTSGGDGDSGDDLFSSTDYIPTSVDTGSRPSAGTPTSLPSQEVKETKSSTLWALAVMILIVIVAILAMFLYKQMKETGRLGHKEHISEMFEPVDTVDQSRRAQLGKLAERHQIDSGDEESVRKYIDSSRARKIPDNQIKEALLEKGWREDQIAHFFV